MDTKNKMSTDVLIFAAAYVIGKIAFEIVKVPIQIAIVSPVKRIFLASYDAIKASRKAKVEDENSKTKSKKKNQEADSSAAS